MTGRAWVRAFENWVVREIFGRKREILVPKFVLRTVYMAIK
jgi:hypothetical protein